MIVYQYVLSLSTPVSCSIEKGTQVGAFFYGSKEGSRTHFNATPQWGVAATSSKTGGNRNIFDDRISRLKSTFRGAFSFGYKYGEVFFFVFLIYMTEMTENETAWLLSGSQAVLMFITKDYLL